MWAVVRDRLGWSSYPQSMHDFWENFLAKGGESGIGLMWFLVGAIVWSLWLHRNECVFNDVVISSPLAIVYRPLSFLQHWMGAERVEGKTALEELVDSIKGQVPQELTTVGVG
jgi:hypothetical protein